MTTTSDARKRRAEDATTPTEAVQAVTVPEGGWQEGDQVAVVLGRAHDPQELNTLTRDKSGEWRGPDGLAYSSDDGVSMLPLLDSEAYVRVAYVHAPRPVPEPEPAVKRACIECGGAGFASWSCPYCQAPRRQPAVEPEPEPEWCPDCRHAPHGSLGFCPNLASDNDCPCTSAYTTTLAVEPEPVAVVEECRHEDEAGPTRTADGECADCAAVSAPCPQPEPVASLPTEGERVYLRARVHWTNADMSFVEFDSMEGPFSVRVPNTSLRLVPESSATVTDEAVEAAARSLVPYLLNPDLPQGARRDPLWTFHMDDARAALTAALPHLRPVPESEARDEGVVLVPREAVERQEAARAALVEAADELVTEIRWQSERNRRGHARMSWVESITRLDVVRKILLNRADAVTGRSEP